MPVLMMSLTACGNKLTAEQAAEAVMQGETDRLPLVKQTLSFLVNDITIDSMRILIAEEPMYGHLYLPSITMGMVLIGVIVLVSDEV